MLNHLFVHRIPNTRRDGTLSQASQRRAPLSCTWTETGNPRQPLACVWAGRDVRVFADRDSMTVLIDAGDDVIPLTWALCA